jgi:dihydroorotate dehydrogenase electron transfer subunit
MPALASSPSVHACTVIDRREAAPGIVVLVLDAPDLARAARPGQFVMATPPGGERVATALGIYEAEADRISLMIVTCGYRTRELANLAPGSALVLSGPLGNGFFLDDEVHDVALVAGGVGIAPLFLPARVLRARGVAVDLYYGARSSEALVDAQKFEALGVRVTLATDDGSRGHNGYVTDALLQSGRRHGLLLACGPSPMLRAAGRAAERLGVRAQLSLEETFACGVGACWGCVVPLDRDSAQAPFFPEAEQGETRDYVHARICKEGPVFWAHELRW